MGTLKVRIDTKPVIGKKIAYLWHVFSQYAGIEYQFVDDNQDLLIGESSNADIPISQIFSENISKGVYSHQHYFDKKPLIYTESGTPDYLSTCFYMLNCLQEYAVNDNDRIGRFPYKDSYQSKFNCVEDNLVGAYFDKLVEQIPILKNLANKQVTNSVYFLSHDNDVLYGSFLQDGLYALKQGRFDIVLKLIFNEILQKPDWRNMSKIMDIENEYDVKSTFFWLVNKGKHGGVNNADYDINSPPIRKLIEEIDARGWENGLHKSTSDESYKQELSKLGFPASANRNHFLQISLPDTFHEIDQAGLELDCSLGFAEKNGLRNSYTLPFHPYDMSVDKAFDFLEISLHVMDATLFNYEKIPPHIAKDKILAFLDKHKTNSVMSILWHNKYFTDYKYKGFLDIYKAILDFMVQNDMKALSAKELTKRYQS